MTYLSLFRQKEATALFFHFLRGNGWSTKSINDWMARHSVKNTYDEEHATLSKDSVITTNLRHDFGLAFVDGKIKYTNNGRRIETIHEIKSRSQGKISLKIGASISSFWGPHPAWQARRFVWPVGKGQTIEISMDVEPGFQWSFRKVGTSAWSKGQPHRKVTIQTPPDRAEDFEFLVTSMSTLKSAMGKLVAKRIN